jgi:hypothetical protein
MKRSVSVTLTLVVSLGAARAQSVDPCNEGTFNDHACQVAIRTGSFCSHGARIKTTYQQSYPYYYDRYQTYVSQGGVVSTGPAQTCPGHWFTIHSGFGATAASHNPGTAGG